MVIVLQRHAEALHELSSDELLELAAIELKVIGLFHEEIKCEKEYLSCYAERGHYNHIHIHIFAKPKDLAIEYKGTKSFQFIDVTESESVPKEDIISLCVLFRERMKEPYLRQLHHGLRRIWPSG